MRVRLATVEDAPAIARFERTWTESSLRSTLALPTTHGAVACEGDGVVGHLLSCVVADSAEILLLAVAPGQRRRGVATALLAAVRDHWQAAGVRTAFLEVRSDNAAAIALYRRAGFRAAGRRPRYYDDGTDAVLMHLELEPCR